MKELVYLTEGVPDYWPGKDADPLIGHRSESWEWNVLLLDESPAGTLDGVQDATLEWSTGNTIRGGGNLTWAGDPETEPTWPRIMLQPWYVLKTPYAEVRWPRGVFIPAATPGSYTDTGRVVEVELYDKLLILDQDILPNTYSVNSGTNVVAAVRAVINGAGQTKHSIEDSDETLKAAMVWEPGTSRLRIVNDLLESINYFSLWADGWGVYQGNPYKDPGSRPTVRVFRDDESSIFAPEFVHDRDLFNTPNRMIAIGRGDTQDDDGEEQIFVGVAENTNPDSPFSYQSRGRWITHVDQDVEATSQAVIDAIADRRLAELSQTSSVVEFSHAHVPLELNDIVEFRREQPGDGNPPVIVRATVQSFSIATATGELQQTRIREVSE